MLQSTLLELEIDKRFEVAAGQYPAQEGGTGCRLRFDKDRQWGKASIIDAHKQRTGIAYEGKHKDTGKCGTLIGRESKCQLLKELINTR